MEGAILTSWSHHMFPFELQMPSILVPQYLKRYPQGSLEEYKDWFIKEFYGVSEGDKFWEATRLLSESSLFTWTKSLGYSQAIAGVRENHVQILLDELHLAGDLQSELERSKRRHTECKSALLLMQAFQGKVTKNRQNLDYWILGAKNMVNRTAVVSMLIQQELKNRLSATEVTQAQSLLRELRTLKAETFAMYREMITEERCDLMIRYIYRAVERELERTIELHGHR